MFNLSFNEELLSIFVAFICIYLKKSPDTKDILAFIEEKCAEKEIVESFNAGLITKDELCSFLLDHIFTKFVLNEEYDDASVEDINSIKEKLAAVIF
ncbi:hypothetical protein [Pseudoalteromonas luteoviolacea]|uniref:Uncharacterized protein n=1 Tax=Pseudoalteromonas luteoviolacea NCIMB 1942 TaxID=1365253 RepID=A0A167HC64_9GAMM|nr:hypothetical protein [Pseudoalteromonas luteoviolacea]KZN57960.1 hypothetical protein N482_22935 [Pseudoalteromonas luteoviolacea NCIMB 1942]